MENTSLDRMPNIKGIGSQYWTALQARKLLYQTCNNCGATIFHARIVCPRCMADDLAWHESCGEGTVYSYTVIYRTSDERFREQVPYVVALVDLKEGFRMMANLVDYENPEAIEIDQPVTVDYQTINENFTIPVFRVGKGRCAGES